MTDSKTVQHHGYLLVNKPAGWTSHDLVDFVRKLFHTRSVGHCGTLDPMASGLMVVLIGEATKFSNYILEQDKGYRVRVQLGLVTDTLDTTGATLETHPITQTPQQIREMAMVLQGEMNLQVPMYSAVKIDGVKLHEYARKGETIEQPLKLMSFFDLRWIEGGKDAFELEMRCSKGSYVRAWVHELGQKLGCGAAMSGLVRTYSAPYTLEEAITTDELKTAKEAGQLADFVRPMTTALPDYKMIRVQGMDETLLGNGQISHGLKSQLISIFNPESDRGVKIISSRENTLLALIGLEQGKGFVIRRVFKYT